MDFQHTDNLHAGGFQEKSMGTQETEKSDGNFRLVVGRIQSRKDEENRRLNTTQNCMKFNFGAQQLQRVT